MPQRLACFLLAASLALVPLFAPAASADGTVRPQAPRTTRVFLVAVEESGIEEWLPREPLAALLAEEPAALLSTRSGSAEPGEARAAGYATLGAGARTVAGNKARALADRLAAAGTSFVTDAGGTVASLIGAAPATGPIETVPSGVILTGGDAQRAAAAVSSVRAIARPDDALVVFSVTARPDRVAARVFLGAVAVVRDGLQGAGLRSETTRRGGLVSLIDIAPTVLDLLGLTRPPGMTGRPVEVAEGRVDLAARDAEYAHTSRARGPLLRGWIIAAMILFVASAIAIARRAHRVGHVLHLLLVAACAAPLAFLLEPLFPGSSVAASAAWGAGLALAFAAAFAGALGLRRGLAALCAATAAVVLADLVLGAILASRSVISYLPSEGARFFGIGNELMGVVAGATLVAITVAYEDAGTSRVAGVLAPLFMAAAAWLMASPSVGAKFGSILTVLPAFGLLAMRAGGRRITPARLLVLETAAAAVTGLVFLADRLRPAAERTHIGGAAGPAAAETLARKIGAALRLLALSIWMVALLVFAAAAFAAARARRDAARTAFASRPLFAACVQAGVLAAISALAFNDAGTVAAAIISLVTGTFFFQGLLDASNAS